MKLKKFLLLSLTLCFSCIFISTNAQMCTADAGEPVADPAPLCPGINSVAGSFGLATGGFTDANGTVDPQTTNYIAFDAAGNLIDITDADGIIDLSELAIGDMACVYQVAYSQETLNDATLFLDDQLCVVLCDAVTSTCAGDAIPGFCPGISPTDLATLFNLLDMAFGFDEAQACNLIDNSILTLPIGPAGADVEINLEMAGFPVCADKSTTPYCTALTACAEPVVCDLMAGEPVPPNATICATGTASMGEPEQAVLDVTAVFGPPVSGVTSNTTVQDYVVVDLATSEIISVSSTAMLDLSDAAIGDMACVYSFSYYLELVELLAAGINDQICNVLCLPDPNDPLNQQCVADLIPGYTCGDTPTDIAGLLDLLNMINQAQGLTDVTFADVQMLCATQMLTIDVGAILGVPGTPPANIDLTLIPGLMGDGFCCDFSNDPHCVFVVDCSVIQPPECTITSIIAASTCAAGDANYSVTVTVIGADASVMIDGGAGPVPASTTIFTYPAGTSYTVTVTDSENFCTFGPFTGQEDCIVDPDQPTTDIPTLSQWGLITLAMLLMIVGSLKLGAANLSFEPFKLK